MVGGMPEDRQKEPTPLVIAVPYVSTGPQELFVSDSAPKNYQRPDMLIVDELAQKLAEDSTLEARNVELACTDRQVVLSGSVSKLDDKRRLEILAATTFGVIDVSVRDLQVVGRAVDELSSEALVAESPGTSHEDMMAVGPSDKGGAKEQQHSLRRNGDSDDE